MSNKFFESSDTIEFLKMVAPGTSFREGLENVLRAKTGALIVVGDSEKIMDLVDGGFNISCNFSPAYLYELAKMDGAIILNYDRTKILYANTQLNPSKDIPSTETGTRHRTAQRIAVQTGDMVIAISQRRNIISLYKGNKRYILRDVNKILANANQAIQTLERYKVSLDQAMTNLSALEYEDLVSLEDVASAIQRTEMLMRIVNEVEKAIVELGEEGKLVSMQLEELIGSAKDDGKLTFKDYNNFEEPVYKEFKKKIRSFSSEDLLNTNHIIKALGYVASSHDAEASVYTRGYRILNKIPKLPSSVIENLIDYFDDFQSILRADINELVKVDGIGEVRARTIRNGLRRIKEQSLLDRHI